MKALIVILAVTFAAFFLVNNDFVKLPENVKREAGTITLPMRIAALSAAQPEAFIKMPLRTVRVKAIADTYGAPRGADRAHQGQDIFAKRGTPIYSATNGYVWRVGENSLGGNTVSVAGAGGRFYYYAHLDKYADNLKIGDYVTPDTILGFVGDTGNAKGTPPHLHFGVYTNGGAVNPLSLLIDK